MTIPIDTFRIGILGKVGWVSRVSYFYQPDRYPLKGVPGVFALAG